MRAIGVVWLVFFIIALWSFHHIGVLKVTPTTITNEDNLK